MYAKKFDDSDVSMWTAAGLMPGFIVVLTALGLSLERGIGLRSGQIPRRVVRHGVE